MDRWVYVIDTDHFYKNLLKGNADFQDIKYALEITRKNPVRIRCNALALVIPWIFFGYIIVSQYITLSTGKLITY